MQHLILHLGGRPLRSYSQSVLSAARMAHGYTACAAPRAAKHAQATFALHERVLNDPVVVTSRSLTRCLGAIKSVNARREPSWDILELSFDETSVLARDQPQCDRPQRHLAAGG